MIFMLLSAAAPACIAVEQMHKDAESRDYFRHIEFVRIMMPLLGADNEDVHEVTSKLTAVVSRSYPRLHPRMVEVVNDILEASASWSDQEIESANDALGRAGALTVTEARVVYSGEFRAIFANGKISNQEEYILARSAVEWLDEPSKSCISAMMEKYEPR
jgi:hypothetical protein